jgi:hypothetical protein
MWCCSSPGRCRQGCLPSSRRCRQRLLRSSVAEQLQQIVRGGDQVPLAIDLLQALQQEAAQAPDLLDLAVHRLYDCLLLRRSLRPALDVDPGSLLASELAGHAGFDIGTPGQWSS